MSDPASEPPSDSPPSAPGSRAGEGTAPPPMDRRQASDRRARTERRKRQVPVPVERRSGIDRRSTDRRDPAKRAGNYDLDDETLEFIAAINRFKAETGRSFPTWSEVMEIVRALGYVKSGG